MATQIAKTAEELGIDDPEAHSRKTRAKLQRALDEHTGVLNEDAQQARDILLGTGPDTATVDFSELTGADEPVMITVKTEVSGRSERTINRLASGGYDDIDDAVDAILDMFEELIVGPSEFTNREVWRAVWEERGSAYLSDCAEKLIEPWTDDMGAVEGFRADG